MTIEEMSNEFDILFNNINSDQAPGLNEYEKSVLLTKAQNELVKNYFNPAGNKYQKGFDGNEKRQIDFSSIIKTEILEFMNESPVIDNRGLVYKFPPNLLSVINETFEDKSGMRYSIIPLAFTEYQRVMMKPYAYPPKKSIWRLISGPTQSGQGSAVALMHVTPTVSNTESNPSEKVPTPLFTYTNLSKKPVKVNLTFLSTDLTAKAATITEDDDQVTIDVQVVIDTRLKDQQATLSVENIANYVTIELNTQLIQANCFGVYYNPSAEVQNTSREVSVVIPAAGSTNKVELIGRTTNENPDVVYTGSAKDVDLYKSIYRCRYVKKPHPIVLVDLDEEFEVTVDGETKASACELPEELHSEVVQRAVELAKVIYEQSNADAVTKLGERSE